MDRTLARRATAATLVLLAMLWLAGPAAAAPVALGPIAPGWGLFSALWSWITGVWTAASPEPSFEKAAPGDDPTTTTTSDPGTDKGVLIDPNGLR